MNLSHIEQDKYKTESPDRFKRKPNQSVESYQQFVFSMAFTVLAGTIAQLTVTRTVHNFTKQSRSGRRSDKYKTQLRITACLLPDPNRFEFDKVAWQSIAQSAKSSMSRKGERIRGKLVKILKYESPYFWDSAPLDNTKSLDAAVAVGMLMDLMSTFRPVNSKDHYETQL